MLSLLKIRNVAIIESAQLEFTDGLNLLTGETGAGKSIILDALGAALGFRTNKGIIRTGANEASVTALFSGADFGVAREILEEYGIPHEEDSGILVSRVITEDKNVCRINGEPVTVSTLRELGSALVCIHGQQDNRELLDSSAHLGYIDSAAENTALLEKMGAQYSALREVEKEIARLSTDEAEKARTADFLSYEINELERACITVGEEQSLKERREVVRNSERLAGLIAGAESALSGAGDSEGAVSGLKGAQISLQEAGRYLADASQLSKQLEEAVYTAQAVAEELRGIAESVSESNEGLEELEERLDLLYKLRLKYGDTEEEMLAYLDNSRQRLEAIVHSDERLEQLKKQAITLRESCEKTASELSERRNYAAREFAARVTNELQYLDMQGAAFSAVLSECEISHSGKDSVELLFSANTGEALRPLSKTASGGELSRVMLAVKNALRSTADNMTLVFDEIDQGISGRAALKVGEKLDELSCGRQIICVTHLAQIAAFARSHMMIEKNTSEGRTFTDVTLLDIRGRQEELARLAGAGAISELQLKSAAELIEYADKRKKGCNQ